MPPDGGAGRLVRALSLAITEKLTRGESPVVEAALVKDLGTGVEQLIPYAIADDLASRTDPNIPLELLHTLHYVTQVAPSYSLRGGTRDIDMRFNSFLIRLPEEERISKFRRKAIDTARPPASSPTKWGANMISGPGADRA